jgi:hypothetical protein
MATRSLTRLKTIYYSTFPKYPERPYARRKIKRTTHSTKYSQSATAVRDYTMLVPRDVQIRHGRGSTVEFACPESKDRIAAADKKKSFG